MAEPDPLRAITELPRDLAALAVQVRSAALQIPRASVDNWFGDRSVLGPVGETYDVAAVRAQWRVFFRTRQSTTFFHFLRDEREWVPLDARVSARMVPVASSSAPGPVVQKVQLPEFVWADPSVQELRAFVPGEPAPDSSILLRLGDDIIGARIESGWKRSRLRYSERGVPGLDWPRQNKYPLSPLLEVIETIAEWHDRGMPSNQRGEFALPAWSGAKPVRDVLDSLADGYLLSRRALLEQPGTFFSPAVWEVTEYSTEATLRLRDDGTLARDEDEEAFRLLLHSETRGSASPEMHITASTGDLAANERLVQSMIDDIRFVPQKLKRVADGLRQSVSAVQFFLDSARARPRAVFLEREDSATSTLLIVQGDLLATPTTVLLRGLFRFHGAPEADRAEFLDHKDFQLIQVPTSEIAATTIDRDAAVWFLRLLASLHRWKELLV
jgi:hypothetical protein